MSYLIRINSANTRFRRYARCPTQYGHSAAGTSDIGTPPLSGHVRRPQPETVGAFLREFRDEPNRVYVRTVADLATGCCIRVAGSMTRSSRRSVGRASQGLIQFVRLPHMRQTRRATISRKASGVEASAVRRTHWQPPPRSTEVTLGGRSRHCPVRLHRLGKAGPALTSSTNSLVDAAFVVAIRLRIAASASACVTFVQLVILTNIKALCRLAADTELYKAK